MKKLLYFVSENAVLFLFASFVFILLRFPSLFEPNWYGDEGVYQVIGRALRAGRMLYSGIWDNKPPILYLLYSFFNSDQFTLRLLSLLVGLVSVWIFIVFFQLLFRSKEKYSSKVLVISVLLFSFFLGSPFLEGNIANAENFMIMPILLSGVLIWESRLGKKKSFVVIAGLLLGIASMIKVVAIFDMSAFFLFLFSQNCKNIKKIFQTLIYLSPFLVSFLIPFIIFCLYFFVRGILGDFLQAIFIQNIAYVGYSNNFIIPQGLLLVKIVLLLIAVLVIISQRKKLHSAESFVFIWFSFTLFNVFFSGRSYVHYLLLLLPSMVFLFSLYFFLRKRGQTILGLGLLIVFLLLSRNFSFYRGTFGYYQNFLSYITLGKSTEDYQSFFDSQTPMDYRVVEFLNLHAGARDAIFVWGNDVHIYSLTYHLPPGKFIVAYHINRSSENRRQTEEVLENTKPKYIVIFPGLRSIPYNLYDYHQRILIGTIAIYEREY